MSYCSKCGKELGDGTRFCPMCGFDTMSQGSGNNSGNNYNQNAGPQYNSNQSRDMGGTLTIIMVLGILWAIGTIGVAIVCFLGEGYLFYFTGGLLFVAGILSLLCGLFTLLSCINIYKLENHQQACTYCLIGSIIALVVGGIIIGVVGIVFYFLMKNEKNRFSS